MELKVQNLITTDLNWRKTLEELSITIKEDETIFTTVSDTFVKQTGEWCCYSDDEIIAYAPLPKPFRPRKRSNKNESKSNNRKTNNKTKS